MDWIFSHADDLDDAVAAAASSGSDSAASTSAAADNTATNTVNDGEGKYTLQSMISHIDKTRIMDIFYVISKRKLILLVV